VESSDDASEYDDESDENEEDETNFPHIIQNIDERIQHNDIGKLNIPDTLIHKLTTFLNKNMIKSFKDSDSEQCYIQLGKGHENDYMYVILRIIHHTNVETYSSYVYQDVGSSLRSEDIANGILDEEYDGIEELYFYMKRYYDVAYADAHYNKNDVLYDLHYLYPNIDQRKQQGDIGKLHIPHGMAHNIEKCLINKIGTRQQKHTGRMEYYIRLGIDKDWTRYIISRFIPIYGDKSDDFQLIVYEDAYINEGFGFLPSIVYDVIDVNNVSKEVMC